jgi:hypothetical protein
MLWRWACTEIATGGTALEQQQASKAKQQLRYLDAIEASDYEVERTSQ